MTDEAPWRRRFRAARTTLPAWADDRPDHLLYASNQSGTWELYAWDRATADHRQLTERKEGTLNGAIDPSGEYVYWFDDTDGDEFGRWMVQPFGGGDAQPVAAALGRAYDTGLELGNGVQVIGRAVEDSVSIYVLRGDYAPRQIYQHAEQAWLGGLSADEQLLCFHQSEHGDARHPALRVVDLDGQTVAELATAPALASPRTASATSGVTSACSSCTSATTCRGQ